MLNHCEGTMTYSGHTENNYFAILALLMVYTSMVSGIIVNMSSQLAIGGFSACTFEMITLLFLTIFIAAMAQYKGFFHRFHWNDEGICQTHLFLPASKWISWKDAVVDNDDYGGFRITGQHKCNVCIRDRYYLSSIDELRKFIIDLQMANHGISAQVDEDRIFWLCDQPSYKAFILDNNLYVNGKEYSLDCQYFVWEGMGHSLIGSQPLYTFGFDQGQEVTVQVSEDNKEDLIHYLKSRWPIVRFVNVALYRSSDHSQLSEKEIQFAKRQMRKWNWRYLKILPPAMVIPFIFHSLDRVSSIYGVIVPQWIIFCFSTVLICLVMFVFWQNRMLKSSQ